MYNLKFRDILFKLGYKQCACKPCLFYRENELGVTMLVSYVDDNAIAGVGRFWLQIQSYELETRNIENGTAR